MKARKYIVKKRFQGMPKRDDYEVVTYETSPLKPGEILVKAESISVDPYLRAYHPLYPIPYDQFSYQVGTVIESKDEDNPVGSTVVTFKGWCDYSVVYAANLKKERGVKFYKLPDLKGLSPSLGVGAAGMPGVTAYYGFLDICKPKAGETVVVTGAAGAVGSLVGQIAKLKGCKVIGFAGSDAKVKWLENELGFDKALNYKTVDVSKALKEAAPNGVDCYFDNVGGELSSLIIYQMNDFGRVSVCGSISSYNEDPSQRPKVSILQPILVAKQLKVEGFHAYRWNEGEWLEAIKHLIQWIKEGKIKTREHVIHGFDKLYDAFMDVLTGANSGKAVVYCTDTNTSSVTVALRKSPLRVRNKSSLKVNMLRLKCRCL